MENNLEYRMYSKRNNIVKLLKEKKQIPFKLMNEYNILINSLNKIPNKQK